jgi:hypothetical protein
MENVNTTMKDSNNGWKLIEWDGNKELRLKCWRKKFRRGHVSVGVGEFKTIVFSFGHDSDASMSSTRSRMAYDTDDLTEQEAMQSVDAADGKFCSGRNTRVPVSPGIGDKRWSGQKPDRPGLYWWKRVDAHYWDCHPTIVDLVDGFLVVISGALIERAELPKPVTEVHGLWIKTDFPCRTYLRWKKSIQTQ